MTSQKKILIKKIILLILLLTFWVINGIHIFTNGGKELAIAILYIIIFLPVTISILLDYEVFSLFVIIIYEIAMLLMGVISLSIGLASKDIASIDIACMISEIAFALFLIAAAIQYLRNKEHTLKILCIIFSVVYLLLVTISFIMYGEFTFDSCYEFIRNVVITLVFSIYIVTFPYVQLKIFKDEK